MWNKKKLHILFLFLLVISCHSNSSRNTYFIKKVKIGMSSTEVVNQMGSNPSKILFDDSTYINQKLYSNLTTYVYDTPPSASSEIYLYFSQGDSLMAIFYDL